MDKDEHQQLNPWFTMWVSPRQTIQKIVDSDPTHKILLLSAVSGVAQILTRASVNSLGDKISLPMIFILAVVLGPILGVAGLYFMSGLLCWTGKWIGGKASGEKIRAAIAWSNVPVIWGLLLWVPELALFGKELFTTETPRINSNPILALILFGFELIIGVWTLVIFLKSLGQVQGFSAWKAFGNLLLFSAIVVITVVVISIIVSIIIMACK